MDNTMMSNTFERVTEANRTAVDAAVQLNKIAVRTQGLLARQQLAAVENWIEAGTKNIRLAAETRDPKELMAKQAEIAVELGEKLMGVAQEALDIQAQARDELVSMVEEGFNAATSAATSAAKPATKTVKKAA